MKKVEQNLKEVSSEMLLHYLHPEMDEEWKVENQGTFYRNFNSDLIAYDEEKGEVQLARDSFTKLLPPGMLFSDKSLKGRGQKNKINKLNDRQSMLRDMFQPFDNMSFLQRISVEREMAALLDDSLNYVLTTLFHYDITKEENPYIRQLAGLLPLVRNLRGDYHLMRAVLSSLFDCEVSYSLGRYSETDQTRTWIPKVSYELLIEGLTPESYEKMNNYVNEVCAFLKEWFFSFETELVLKIKWHNQSWNETRYWLLEYNTELKK